MLPQDIAKRLAQKTVKVPELDKAYRFVFAYLEGLSALTSVDLVETIRLLGQIDKRFKAGNCKEMVKISNAQFNPTGTIFIGRVNASKWRDEGNTGILFIMGGGI